jgi:hypothetical protein
VPNNLLNTRLIIYPKVARPIDVTPNPTSAIAKVRGILGFGFDDQFGGKNVATSRVSSEGPQTVADLDLV